MLEASVLKLLLKKDNYLKYYNYLKKLSVEKEYSNLYKLVNNYYNEFTTHEYISLDELKAYFSVQYKGIKNPDLYMDIFTQVEKLEVSDSVGEKIIRSMIERHCATQMMPLLLDLLEDRQSTVLEKIQDYIDEADDMLHGAEAIEQEYVTDDLDILLSKEMDAQGLRWRLPFLNYNASPARGGLLLHAFARTDGGKTSFLMSECSYWAEQLSEGERGLWFNNEGSSTKIKLRWFNAVLGRSSEIISQHRDLAKEHYFKKGGHRVNFVNKTALHVHDIERHMKKVQPKFVVIDIGDKVKCRSGKDARSDEILGILYAEYRQLALEYDCPIITSGQANNDASGQLYLNETMMAASRTAKPGELDLAIGIGFKDKDDPRRYLALPKNKLNADPEFTKSCVRFNRATCRFEVMK